MEAATKANALANGTSLVITPPAHAGAVTISFASGRKAEGRIIGNELVVGGASYRLRLWRDGDEELVGPNEVCSRHTIEHTSLA